MKSPVARLCVNIYYKGISKNLAHKTIDLSDVYVKKSIKLLLDLQPILDIYTELLCQTLLIFAMAF